MQHHIILLFLSPVRAGRDGLVASLECTGVGTVMQTNESAVRYLQKSNQVAGRLEKIFVMASRAVRETVIKAGNVPEGMTTLDFFKYRLGDCPDRPENCVGPDTLCPYDEEADTLKAQAMTLEMATKIQSFVSSCPAGDEILLHVDCTGGPRDANMIMMSVVRLLEYDRRVHVGQMLYARMDYSRQPPTIAVQEIGPIYQMMEVVAGAEEFVRFGSIEALTDYFAGHAASSALQRLLSAMRHFADEVKLCHRGSLKQAADELQAALQEFNTPAVGEAEECLNDRFLLLFKGRIQEEYREFFSGQGNELAPLSWCLSRGYLQQALTLYTECVPEYLSGRGYITMDENQRRKYLQMSRQYNVFGGDKEARNLAYLVFNVYPYFYLSAERQAERGNQPLKLLLDRQRSRYKDKERAHYIEALRETVLSLLKGQCTGAEALAMLRERTGRLTACYQGSWWHLEAAFALLEALRADASPLEDSEPPEALQYLVRCYKRWLRSEPGKDMQSDWEQLNGQQRLAKLGKFIRRRKLNNDELLHAFGTLQVDMSLLFRETVLKQHDFSSTIDEQTLIGIYQRYKVIQNERNRTNHARETADRDEFDSAYDLLQFMQAGIRELQSCDI